MKPTPKSLSADLLKLQEFLKSDATSENRIQLSELDGFLSGLAAGPEPIPVEEWMAEIWEDECPHFADEAQRTEILGTIIRRWSEIAQTLDDDKWVIQPILWTNEDGEVLADDWAEGFLKAMRLRWDAWQPLFAHSVRGEALVPILLLCDSEEGEPLIPIRPSPDDPLYQEISKLIPDAVADIYEFWLERELTPQPIRVLPKIGRNDPCPCGSGKKFKRCCAAA